MKILILTGAGISAASGLPTFRDDGGLWLTRSSHETASAEAFERNPGQVLDFYNERRTQISRAVPNAAHIAIGQLQMSSSHKVIVITQNIDDLHERAGSGKVMHVHGSIMEAKCSSCWQIWRSSVSLEPEDVCPYCDEATVRPNVVLFGEAPHHREYAERAAAKADLFVSVGTSGTVFPASGLIDIAKAAGANTLEFNSRATSLSHKFEELRTGDAAKTIPLWVSELLPA